MEHAQGGRAPCRALACDYDGTLPEHDKIAASTRDGLSSKSPESASVSTCSTRWWRRTARFSASPRRRGVPCQLGRVLLATTHDHRDAVLAALAEADVPLDLLANR